MKPWRSFGEGPAFVCPGLPARQTTTDSLRFVLIKFIFCKKSFKKLAAPAEALAKAGGGDGSRTHVRRTDNKKRYMFIL